MRGASNLKERKLKTVLTIGFFLSFSISVALDASDEPQTFFNDYIRLGDAFDPAVADLYFDQALIHAYRVYPHGLERNMELSGVQWKQLVIQIMPLAKAQNDKSTFSNIRFTEINGGYKIKADRYSVRKCYTDTGYYMIVKPSENGNLKIIEEYMETKPLPNC
jgi:hypothetical protein